MLECDICHKQIDMVCICEVCGRGFCEEQGHPLCPVCGRLTIISELERQSYGDMVVEWLPFDGSIRIGVSCYTTVPRILLSIRNWLSQGNGKKNLFDVVVFPTKRDSNEFTKELAGGSKSLPPPIEMPSAERSRYRLVSDESHHNYLLLNGSALSDDSVRFLLDWLSKFLVRYGSRPSNFKNALRIVFDVVKTYNSKFGIPFVVDDEEIKPASLRVAVALWQGFAESKTLSEIIDSSNSTQASYFLEENFDIVFANIDWEMKANFYEVLNIFGVYIRVLTVLGAVGPKSPLYSFLAAKFDDHHKSVKSRLFAYPDFVNALEQIIEEMRRPSSFSSFEEYIAAVGQTLMYATKMLKPSYVRLSEITSILETALEFSRQIEGGRESGLGKFSSPEDLLFMCRRIYEDQSLYPEVSILAAYAILIVLGPSVLVRRDRAALDELIQVSRELPEMIVRNLPSIRDRNPGCAIKVEDGALCLLTSSAYANFLDGEEGKQLSKEAEAFIEKHDIVALKFQTKWLSFLLGHDYDVLRELPPLLHRLDRQTMNGFSEYSRFIGHIVTALVQPNRKMENLAKAEDLAFEATYVGSTKFGPFSAWIGQMAFDLSYFVTGLLRALFNCERTLDVDTVRRLLIQAKVLDEELSSIHPLRTFVYKTYAICFFFSEDANRMEDALENLMKIASPSSPLIHFVEIIRRWNATPGNLRTHRLYQLLETEFDQADPWSRMLQAMMSIRLRKELTEQDILRYDAVMFVEGEIDISVYSEISQVLQIGLEVLFIDTEGWTNMQYYANAKITSNLRKPIVLVFDGDTESSLLSDVKRRLVNELSVPLNNIVTLSKNSVEDYLLDPRSIKKAFPKMRFTETEIAQFLEDRKGKRNKKEVLDSLLQASHVGRYDKSTAGMIASSMAQSTIAEELRDLFARLTT